MNNPISESSKISARNQNDKELHPRSNEEETIFARRSRYRIFFDGERQQQNDDEMQHHERKEESRKTQNARQTVDRNGVHYLLANVWAADLARCKADRWQNNLADVEVHQIPRGGGEVLRDES